jgi:hypothetical protein
MASLPLNKIHLIRQQKRWRLETLLTFIKLLWVIFGQAVHKQRLCSFMDYHRIFKVNKLSDYSELIL